MTTPVFPLPSVVLVVFLMVLYVSSVRAAWSDYDDFDRIKLVDVKAITLYKNRMTAGRRTSPIPQLQCVGGTAGCSAFVPNVVQCYNRGSDGHDVQWECKTDMSNAYRFGNIEVACEGYNYPNDPYILKGSCGLEYTIDYTEEGSRKQQSYFKWSDGSYNKIRNHDSKYGHLIILVVIGIIIYALYKTCLENHQFSNTNTDYPGGNDQNRGGFFGNLFGGHRGQGYGEPPPAYGAPPQAGFRPEFVDPASCGATSGTSRNSSTGFWTGAMTGGLLGYMLGRNNQGTYGSTSGPSHHTSPGYAPHTSYRELPMIQIGEPHHIVKVLEQELHLVLVEPEEGEVQSHV